MDRRDLGNSIFHWTSQEGGKYRSYIQQFAKSMCGALARDTWIKGIWKIQFSIDGSQAGGKCGSCIHKFLLFMCDSQAQDTGKGNPELPPLVEEDGDVAVDVGFVEGRALVGQGFPTGSAGTGLRE